MDELIHRLNRVTCIINPGAAKEKWLRRKKLNCFLKDNLPGQKFDIFGKKEDTIEIARKVSPQCETVVAVGGDGTIADVLQGIREARREKDILLGIIPLGSGNAFRKSLAIPTNIKKAIRVLSEGTTKEIDLMDINGRIAGFASIGATARITEEKQKNSIYGLWGHVLAGVKLFFKLPRWDMEVELEGGIDDAGNAFALKTIHLKALDCVVAKSNYFGYSWRIAPRASLEDAYLDITFYEMRVLKYALLLPLNYFGLLQRRLRHFKARKLILRGKNLPIQYHGEALGTCDRVEIRVLPRLIKVICPG